MRRWLAVLLHLGVQAVRACLISVGLAAILSTLFVLTLPTEPEWAWIGAIRQLLLTSGPIFLVAGGFAVAMLPSRRELRRLAFDDAERPLSDWLVYSLIALAALSVAQFGVVAAWWSESRSVIDTLGRDPLGMWMIPATLVSAAPFFASLAIALFLLTSGVVIASRPRLALRLLRACVVLQVGLVGGSWVAMAPMRALGARLLALLASTPDPALEASVADAVARQELFAAALLFRAQWICGGYLLLLWALAFWPPFANAAPSAIQPALVPVGGDGGRPESPLPPPIVTPVSAAEPAVAAPGDLFTSAGYRVRLETSWFLAAFWRPGGLDYTIAPLLEDRSGGFSFSSLDGLLRRVPERSPLLKVQRNSGFWPYQGSSYEISDASNGAIVAIVEAAGVDWNVFDRGRRPVGQIEEIEAGFGRCRYRLEASGSEACVFTWAMLGLGVWTAELHVEFSPDASSVARAVAIAFAPVLEAQARRTSQRANS